MTLEGRAEWESVRAGEHEVELVLALLDTIGVRGRFRGADGLGPAEESPEFIDRVLVDMGDRLSDNGELFKERGPSDSRRGPSFFGGSDRLLSELLPAQAGQADQACTEEQQGPWLGNRRCTAVASGVASIDSNSIHVDTAIAEVRKLNMIV